jgi:hypothetical protein
MANDRLSDGQLRSADRYSEEAEEAEDRPHDSVVCRPEQATNEDVEKEVRYVDASRRNQK